MAVVSMGCVGCPHIKNITLAPTVISLWTNKCKSCGHSIVGRHSLWKEIHIV